MVQAAFNYDLINHDVLVTSSTKKVFIRYDSEIMGLMDGRTTEVYLTPQAEDNRFVHTLGRSWTTNVQYMP